MSSFFLESYLFSVELSCVCYHMFYNLQCRGRAVTNVVRTCGPTPLLYYKSNKICLNYQQENVQKAINHMVCNSLTEMCMHICSSTCSSLQCTVSFILLTIFHASFSLWSVDVFPKTCSNAILYNPSKTQVSICSLSY